MEKTFAPIVIKVSDVVRVPPGTYKRSSIRNISFDNITATDCFSYYRGREMPCVIWGKPNAPIEGIAFNKVWITAKGGHSVADADVEPPENDEQFPGHVGVIPAYAWYLRHAKDVTFTDCGFGCEKSDGRPALVIDNVDSILLENSVLPIGSECSSRVTVRGQATHLTIHDCVGLSDMRLTVNNRSF